ncbi:general substrate transporter [Kockovaella imperatae]|uniref:General substrate transporter n=1 Tax=Kockovaella imperatae TaxID=4999 RepID=A0A1Y1UJC4_9TREE|nr:general substrate transporter [Kockovaella imperatae]ORX38163.1 general substrate transporter [Kockovaella imperatae]
MSQIDEKADIIQNEAPILEGGAQTELNHEGVRKSAFDNLGVWETAKTFRRAVFFCVACYTMSMLDGWSVSVAGSIVVNKGFVNQFGTRAGQTGVQQLSPTWLSAWQCMYNCGQFLCLPTIPYIANRYGRVFVFWMSLLSFLIGMVCLTIARTPAVWTVGQFFCGLSGAMEQLSVTPYAVEIAPTRIRGGLVTFQAVWSSIFQIILAFMLEIMNRKYPYDWLKPLYVVWPLAGIIFVAIILLPESPWFYARRGNKEKAIKSLNRLYKGVPGYDVEEEYAVILRTLSHEQQMLDLQGGGESWLDLFRRGNLKRTVIVMAFEAGILLGGLSMVGNFKTYFFAIAGGINPFLANLITSIVNLFIVAVYSAIADKIGRRTPVLVCFIVVCVTLWIMGGLYYVSAGKVVGGVLVTCACLWSGAETITQNVYWLMAAELPSAQLRLKTCSAGLFWGAALGMSTVFAVPPSLDALGLRSSFIWAALTVPVCVFLYFYLPETKGRCSAEIDELFERGVPAWKWSTTVTSVEDQLREAQLSGQIANKENFA